MASLLKRVTLKLYTGIPSSRIAIHRLYSDKKYVNLKLRRLDKHCCSLLRVTSREDQGIFSLL